MSQFLKTVSSTDLNGDRDSVSDYEVPERDFLWFLSHCCLNLSALNNNWWSWPTGLDIFKLNADQPTSAFGFSISNIQQDFFSCLSAFQQTCLWLSRSFHFSQQLKTGFTADAAEATRWSLYNPTAGVFLLAKCIVWICDFFLKAFTFICAWLL